MGRRAERVKGTPPTPWSSSCRRREPADTPPLSKRQWGYLALVLLFSQGLQVFARLGDGLRSSCSSSACWSSPSPFAWFIDAQPNVLASFELWGRDLVVTEELLRVTGFLTVFAGLYFSVTALTDDVLPEGVHRRVLEEMRRSLAVRAVVSRGAEPYVASRAGYYDLVNVIAIATVERLACPAR